MFHEIIANIFLDLYRKGLVPDDAELETLLLFLKEYAIIQLMELSDDELAEKASPILAYILNQNIPHFVPLHNGVLGFHSGNTTVTEETAENAMRILDEIDTILGRKPTEKSPFLLQTAGDVIGKDYSYYEGAGASTY